MQAPCLAHSRHHGICLEDIVENFDHEWEKLRAFLHLDATAPLAAEPKCMIADLDEEPWKNQALSGVVATDAQGRAGLRAAHPRLGAIEPFALRGDPREDRAWRLRTVRVQWRTDS